MYCATEPIEWRRPSGPSIITHDGRVPTAPIFLLLATAAYAGFQWTVHVVVYRQFAAVPSTAFGEYERLHQRRVSFVVGPLFAALIGAAGWLLVARPQRLPPWALILPAVLVVVILAATGLLAVPLHRRLSAGLGRHRVPIADACRPVPNPGGQRQRRCGPDAGRLGGLVRGDGGQQFHGRRLAGVLRPTQWGRPVVIVEPGRVRTSGQQCLDQWDVAGEGGVVQRGRPRTAASTSNPSSCRSAIETGLSA